MSKVLFPLADGFEEIEAIAVIDVLRRGGVEVVIAAIAKRNVISVHGVNIVADAHIGDVKAVDFDAVVLPGGDPGFKNLAESKELIKIIQEFDKAGKLIGAICAAPYVLSVAGVIKKAYTNYPSYETLIKKDGYEPNKNVVIDDNIITSRGPATAIEFALALLERLKGKEVSATISKNILAS